MADKTDKKISAPSISLPKGGGAIKGIGETFQPNPFNGTGNLSIPINTSPCRDFEPELSLTYSSGSGNGVFGIGFSLSIPDVSRKTEKGLPKYQDPDSDTFILSSAEDLVPMLEEKSGKWITVEKRATLDGKSYRVIRYRPRTEGLFARIELWLNLSTGDIHWEVTSKENVKSVYGKRLETKIVDPDNPSRVFKWLIEETSDAKGNRILYEYKSEDSKNVSNVLNEKGRNHISNKYIKRIRYGNYFDEGNNEKWSFEIVFDYGEHDVNNHPHKETLPWKKRTDSISSYRAGFEIRTHRLCHRVLMFHHFPELGNAPCLVRSTDFEYDETPEMSFMKTVRQKGYKKKNGEYDTAEMPPLEFKYSNFDPKGQDFKALSVETGETLPGLIDQSGYLMVDLYGEGISGILYSHDSNILYWKNCGDGSFAKPQTVKQFPIESDITRPELALLDLGGDGKLDLVLQSPTRAGFYQSHPDETWDPFMNFESYPVTDVYGYSRDMVDLSGDGLTDVLVMEDEYLSYYPSKGKKGYDGPIILVKDHDEDVFPGRKNDFREETVRFADMFGDGLNHIVRVRNGIVECWPNLGYGRFGKRILLGNAPRFDESMDASRIFLADIDGSGTTDLIYVNRDKFEVYFNQSGNSFSEPISIPLPQGFDNHDRIQIGDVLGNGTFSLVITNSRPGYEAWRHEYYDFTGGVKPHLLIEMTNNLGATTRVRYRSSTKFYLEDEKSARPWISRLPFPVHLVEKTETIDHISGSKIVTRYRYHHGFYDGEEREFRGFGCVEHWDTESFEQFSQTDLIDDVPFDVTEKGLHVPPVYTKTWYHTGAYEREGVLSKQYEKEYYNGDKEGLLLADSVFDASYAQISTEGIREAYRALRGQVLRQEIYAEDNKPGPSEHPYTVTEANFKVRLVQPKHGNKHAVFFIHPNETIAYHYERDPADPRIEHQFTLEVDDFGNVLNTCNVYYPRRQVPGKKVYPEQTQLRAISSINKFINETGSYYLIGVACENKGFEIGGLDLQGRNYFTFTDLKKQVAKALQTVNTIRYDEALSHQQLQSRLLSWNRHYYWNENQDNHLSLGSLTELALLHHTEEAIFSAQQIQDVFGVKVTDTMLKNEGGYSKSENYWWNPGLVQHYGNSDQFYLPTETEDPFGAKVAVQYDVYLLSPIKVQDPLSNITKTEIDYVTLQPKKLIDSNDNVTVMLFDPLGMVNATSIYGTENNIPKGDSSLSQYQDIFPPTVKDVLTNPHKYLQKATGYFYHDLFAWKKRGEPIFSINLLRETHESDLAGTEKSNIQFHIQYSDGFGREIQKKVKVEGGRAFLRDQNGNLLYDSSGKPVEGDTADRWLISGRTVYNNKSKPVKKYEPFYSATASYEAEKELTEHGVTPVIHYDPVLRVIRTDTPKGFFSKVEFFPWVEKSWDENDTIADSKFYAENINNNTLKFKDERDALTKALKHYLTPKESFLNNLGQRFLFIEKNHDHQELITHYELDVEKNELSITDPRQYELNKTRPPQDKVRTYVHIFDMAETKLSVDSVDAGLSFTLQNAMEKPIHSWDSRGLHLKTTYDELHRALEVHVKGNGLNQIVEKMEYGEGQTTDKEKNLRGELVKHHDQAGIEYFHLYDIKGEVRISRRQLRKEYEYEVNWNNPAAVSLENEIFQTENAYDALGRIVEQKHPDGSTYSPVFNQLGLLKNVGLTFLGMNNPITFVKNVTYNAKEQREKIEYGNGVNTIFDYEPETFRLNNLNTTRKLDNRVLQDIVYTYDPVGNVSRLIDRSHKTIFSNQQSVEPLCDYTYDALYQLIKATGREHPALSKHDYKKKTAFKQSQFIHLNDAQKLQIYTQNYGYDDSGNLTQMKHIASNSSRSWTRKFKPSKKSNRTVPEELLQNNSPDDFFDENGNMKDVEHLRDIKWNYRDNISSVDKIQRENGQSDSEYYVYDSDGDRIRKVHERYANGGSVLEIEETIYLGSYEMKRIKRKINNQEKLILERKTLHVMDDKQRIAIVHHWTKDEFNRETNNVGQRKIHYQISNHLGSSSLELSENAEIISYEDYFPYGGTSVIAGQNQKEVKIKRYRYSGKERDDSTGLYYFGARYYVTWIGRWLSCDPEGIVDGLNVYRYVQSNPVNFLDPKGTQTAGRENWQKEMAYSIGYWWGKAGRDIMYAKFAEPTSVTATLRALDSIGGAIGHTVLGIAYTGGRRTLESVQDLLGMLPPQLDELAVAAQSTGCPQGIMGAGGLRASSIGLRLLSGGRRLGQVSKRVERTGKSLKPLVTQVGKIATKVANAVKTLRRRRAILSGKVKPTAVEGLKYEQVLVKGSDQYSLALDMVQNVGSGMASSKLRRLYGQFQELANTLGKPLRVGFHVNFVHKGLKNLVLRAWKFKPDLELIQTSEWNWGNYHTKLFFPKKN